MVKSKEIELIRSCARLCGLQLDHDFYEDRIDIRRRIGGVTLFTGRSEAAADWFWRYYGRQVYDEIELRLPPSSTCCSAPPQEEWPLIDDLKRGILRLNDEVDKIKRKMEQSPGITEDRFWKEMKRVEEEEEERRRQRNKSSDEMNRKITEAVEEHRRNTGEKANLVRLGWWHPYKTGVGFLRSEPMVKEVGYE